MTCYTCHLSWTTSCAGCHLPIQANWKTERLHYEGGETRNYATYNPQVARDDMFQLGRHGPVKGARIAPVRSSSALVLSSTNANRERIYIQQAPVSASGFSSQAFAPHYPHTERKTETKTCSDCHVSRANDNNAIMAQLLLLGTNLRELRGPNAGSAWTAASRRCGSRSGASRRRCSAPICTYAYPDFYKLHVEKNGRELKDWRRGEAFVKGLKGGERAASEEHRNAVTRPTSGPLPAAARRVHVRGRGQGRVPRL